tara:strand:- start:46 stop:255 length:210 start_codon:yes stop_codon:yes gene_type:complete
MTMMDAELTPKNAFAMLKAVLAGALNASKGYTIDGIELELYQFKMQCRAGLNKDAVEWADELIDLWVNS